jgi:hypothetical protein
MLGFGPVMRGNRGFYAGSGNLQQNVDPRKFSLKPVLLIAELFIYFGKEVDAGWWLVFSKN